MLGRLFCWLGLHQPVVTVPGTVDPERRRTGGWATSAYGRCARCDKPYQWDH